MTRDDANRLTALLVEVNSAAGTVRKVLDTGAEERFALRACHELQHASTRLTAALLEIALRPRGAP